MRRGGAALLAAALCVATAAARAGDYAITVQAAEHDYAEAPVSVRVQTPADGLDVALWEGDRPIPVQAQAEGLTTTVTWIERGLHRGETRRYRLAFNRPGSGSAPVAVTADRNGPGVDLLQNGAFITHYDVTTGPNKPYFYPLLGPGGLRLTRGYPLQKIAGEKTTDHPHHRGLWFTHGEVNGEDFWSEEPKAAKTVHRGFDEVISGPVYGGFRAHTDWITREGRKIAEDVRDVRAYNTQQGRLLDFTVTVRPTGGPLIFGDTKEGSFGIRLPDSMRVAGGGGHIETSAGIRDAASWGTRADWVDYYGPVDGLTGGIAILDGPANPRHPTYWHVRDYGLFAANPFGIHDFVKGQPAKAGNLTVLAGGTITFRYRLYLHAGSTSAAHVAAVWTAYATPPRVTVVREDTGVR